MSCQLDGDGGTGMAVDQEAEQTVHQPQGLWCVHGKLLWIKPSAKWTNINFGFIEKSQGNHFLVAMADPENKPVQFTEWMWYMYCE